MFINFFYQFSIYSILSTFYFFNFLISLIILIDELWTSFAALQLDVSSLYSSSLVVFSVSKDFVSSLSFFIISICFFNLNRDILNGLLCCFDLFFPVRRIIRVHLAGRRCCFQAFCFQNLSYIFPFPFGASVTYAVPLKAGCWALPDSSFAVQHLSFVW